MTLRFKLQFFTKTTPNNDGFTLAEMLVVLMIFAMMTTLSFPYIAGQNRSTESEKFAYELQSLFKNSKQLALMQNQQVEVFFLQSPRRFKSEQIKAEVKVPSVLGLKINIGRDEISPDKFRLIFYPNGSTSGGNFKVVGDRKRYSIKVDWLTGKINIIQEKLAR